jgi:adenine-specific DNA-methyltransferase
MRYFGSKISTIETVYGLVSELKPSGTFCDPFGGICSVGSFFRKKGYLVWSGDILTFPYFFQIAKLKSIQTVAYKKLLSELKINNISEIEFFLNTLSSRNGWFVREYSEKRSFFTKANAMKIQACRQTIKTWSKNGWINSDEHAVLLASLIESMDRVANTAGTYYAYLKNWYRKAIIDFSFKFITPVSSALDGQCFLESADKIVKRRHFDILYLDPPYNDRSYAHYYHLPETIATEKSPKVFGKSGMPKGSRQPSEYNRKADASKALLNLLKGANFNLLVFHYSDNGIISPKELLSILSIFGDVQSHKIDTVGYTSKSKTRKTKHNLYLVTK